MHMPKSTRNFFKLLTGPLVLLCLSIVMVPVVAHAAAVSPKGLPDVKADTDTIKTVLTIVFGVIGAFALLGITVSGLKYIMSAGDAQKTSEAKNGIIYSLVGLAVAISAEALVAFVVKSTG